MKVSTEKDNNFGYEKITIVVDNMPLTKNLMDSKLKGVVASWSYSSLFYNYLWH